METESLARDRPLYDKRVVCRHFMPEREDRVKPLRVRLMVRIF